jgi:hypothetical protein
MLLSVTIILFSLSLLFSPQWQLQQLDVEHSGSDGEGIKLEHFDDIEFGIKALTGIFALLLFALSILAYRRTRFKMIIYAAGAFALFAIQLLLQSLGETFRFLESPITNIISSAITLAILILFFLAIVRAK